MDKLMRRISSAIGVLVLLVFPYQVILAEAVKQDVAKPNQVKKQDSKTISSFPLRRNIVTTYFWIGQGGTSISPTTNIKSAWDSFWKKNFGGIDCPDQRKDAKKFREASLPRKFAPTLNPFYVAPVSYTHLTLPTKA